MKLGPKAFPDHHDAELVLRAYELRREPVLREARRKLSVDWWPKSIEDLTAVVSWEHPLNPEFRQVTSYWELVYGMARHGIVHGEYLAEACGAEALILLVKVEAWLAEFRATGNPRFLRNTEWIAKETAYGREVYDRMKPRVDKMREAR